MTDHVKWTLGKDEAAKARLRDLMVAYTEGYILALNDVRRDLDEIDLKLRVFDSDDAAHLRREIQAKVSVSLKEARASLRMWRGQQDEQTGSDAASD